MLVRGRRVYPRHLFPELVAPWIHYQRFKLRVVWFFTTPINIVPMWTTSVVMGILGVMLTILLFRPAPDVHAATVSTLQIDDGPPTPATELAPREMLPLTAADLFPAAGEPGIDITTTLVRTGLPRTWNQTEQVTLDSRDFRRPDPNRMFAARDHWEPRNAFRLGGGSETFEPYRASAASFDPSSPASIVESSDLPPLFGRAGERLAALTVSREPAVPDGDGRTETYSLVVRNESADPLSHVVVTETVSDLDRVELAHPAAQVSENALHWTIDTLASGAERRFAVTIVPVAGQSFESLAEARVSVEVATAIMVAAAQPVQANSSIPLRREPEPSPLAPTPAPAAVEPASDEFAPPVRTFEGTPRLSMTARKPGALVVGSEYATIFEVSNTGTADAADVILTVRVPGLLQHHDGPLVEHRIAKVAAGTTRRAIFKALAREDGAATLDAELQWNHRTVDEWTADVVVRGKPITEPAAPIAEPVPAEAPAPAASPVPAATPRSNSMPSASPPEVSIPSVLDLPTRKPTSEDE